MKKVKAKELKRDDIILIGNRLELVTETHDHTFYSAPILDGDPHFPDEIYRRASHWVGSLEMDDEVIRFDSIDDAFEHIKSEIWGLIKYYTDGDVEIKKLRLKCTGVFRDGGTMQCYDYDSPNGLEYFIDRRINSSTKGKVFDKYPGQKGARMLNVEYEMIF